MNRLPKWLRYAIAAGVLWGMWGIITKFISEAVNPYTSHLLFTTGMVLTVPFIVRRLKSTGRNSMGIFWGMTAGTFAIAGNIAVYYAFGSGGDATVVIPLTNLYPIVTVGLSIVFLKEHFSRFNFFGLLLALPAIILLSGQIKTFSDPFSVFQIPISNQWFGLSLVALLCWGLFSVCQKLTTSHLSPQGSYFAFVVVSTILSICFIIAGKTSFEIAPVTLILGVCAGFLNGLGVLCSFVAYSGDGKASSVTVVAGVVQPLITIIIAIFLLNEEFTLPEFAGAILAISGSVFLSYEK
jgi:drug/metabolite transporter (DMT)-like permease